MHFFCNVDHSRSCNLSEMDILMGISGWLLRADGEQDPKKVGELLDKVVMIFLFCFHCLTFFYKSMTCDIPKSQFYPPAISFMQHGRFSWIGGSVGAGAGKT